MSENPVKKGLRDYLPDAHSAASAFNNQQNSLADLLYRRPEARGLYYRNQNIKLDGYSFIGCRFDNCQLEATSTNFDLINCIIDPSTTISYGAQVRKILQLFNSRYDWALEAFGQFFTPVKNPDGTITISDRVPG